MYGHTQLAGGVAGATTTLGGALPFTGLSLVWWVLLAATLIAVGASFWRAGHAVGRVRRGDRPECVPNVSRGYTSRIQSHDPAD